MSVSAPLRFERLRSWAGALGLSMAGGLLVGSLIAGFASMLAVRWLEGLWLSLIGVAFLSCLGFFISEGIRDAIRRQASPSMKSRNTHRETASKTPPAPPSNAPTLTPHSRPLGGRLEPIERPSVAMAAKARARGRARS